MLGYFAAARRLGLKLSWKKYLVTGAKNVARAFIGSSPELRLPHLPTTVKTVVFSWVGLSEIDNAVAGQDRYFGGFAPQDCRGLLRIYTIIGTANEGAIKRLVASGCGVIFTRPDRFRAGRAVLIAVRAWAERKFGAAHFFGVLSREYIDGELIASQLREQLLKPHGRSIRSSTGSSLRSKKRLGY